MTDKEKFRKEVERLKSNLIHGACASQIAMETRCKEEAYNEVLALLNTMQKEPVSEQKLSNVQRTVKNRTMSKAENRALERFPVHKGASKEWIELHLKDECAEYIEGYHQAEKDLALTWEDIVYIIETYNELEFSREFATVTFNDTCKEVLKRFKERKEK